MALASICTGSTRTKWRHLTKLISAILKQSG
jgi:hypothetical protein